jgi:hypothetical protein
MPRPGDRLRHRRQDLVFYAAAVFLAAGAVLQVLVLGEWVAAAALALVAGYLASHPYLRAGWYEMGYDAGHKAGLPSLSSGEPAGYAIFASEPIGGDPHRRAVMVMTSGIKCRALLDPDGHQTAEWIVTMPLPAGARIVSTQLHESPA